MRILRQSGWREVSLGMLVSGDVFGEYALLFPPGNNTATCRTASLPRLLRLPFGHLRTAIGQNAAGLSEPEELAPSAHFVALPPGTHVSGLHVGRVGVEAERSD